jgi:hypothetical protein
MQATNQAIVDDYTSAVEKLKSLDDAIHNAVEPEQLFLLYEKEQLQRYVFALALKAAYVKLYLLDKETLSLLVTDIDWFTIGTEYYTTIFIILFLPYSVTLNATGVSYESHNAALDDAIEKGIKFLSNYPIRLCNVSLNRHSEDLHKIFS